MAVVKIVELIGSSLNSWEEAAGNAVRRANILISFVMLWATCAWAIDREHLVIEKAKACRRC